MINLRCPECNSDSVDKRGKKYICMKCNKKFDNIKPLAIIDGVFLDKNKDMRIRSERYLDEACKSLDLSDKIKILALSILEKYGMWGSRAVIAASLWLASCKKEITIPQWNFVEALKTSEATLRNHAYKMATTMGWEIISRGGKVKIKNGSM